ncbi:aminotransferase class I/II-fold pyridoxal phosphate-dependent enzyme, partial [candidate division WOR-3 bacterium]|nr:aminotransferase class I/II-fold pyridoxal phosphate-dependent enzyme [candidate division WOR-3 bacterium]
LVISDEIYDQIIFDGRKHYSFANVSEEAMKRTIIVNGVSKTFAMTGWRLGWLIAEEDIAGAAAKISSHTISCASSVSQKASLEAMKAGFGCVETMRNEYQKRRDVLKNMLSDMPSLKIAPLEGAFFAWLDISDYIGKKWKSTPVLSSDELASYLLKEHHVALVPGHAFGDDKALRISYAASEEDIRKGIGRLKKGLSQLD